jgi:hypothetical protein
MNYDLLAWQTRPLDMETENVYTFTHKDCDPYVTDPSARQGGAPHDVIL